MPKFSPGMYYFLSKIKVTICNVATATDYECHIGTDYLIQLLEAQSSELYSMLSPALVQASNGGLLYII